jgi:tRNA (guanosine-2'-O-)-methyltransferase
VEQDLFEYLQSYLTDRRKQLFSEVLANRTRHFTVVTEDVYQLHNTSAVVRSCDVFGIQDLHVVEDRKGKRVDRQIAMGAQKWVDIKRYARVEECIVQLRKEGYSIIATTPHRPTVTLDEFPVETRAAFFFGKEDTGLSDKVIDLADERLAIPMYGFTESLNISVSAAIVLQHLVAKLRNARVNWQLSPAERHAIEIDWTKRSIKHVDKIIARYTKDNIL